MVSHSFVCLVSLGDVAKIPLGRGLSTQCLRLFFILGSSSRGPGKCKTGVIYFIPSDPSGRSKQSMSQLLSLANATQTTKVNQSQSGL